MHPCGHWSCWLPIAHVGNGQLPLSTVSYTQYRHAASAVVGPSSQLLAANPAETPTMVKASTAGMRSGRMRAASRAAIAPEDNRPAQCTGGGARGLARYADVTRSMNEYVQAIRTGRSVPLVAWVRGDWCGQPRAARHRSDVARLPTPLTAPYPCAGSPFYFIEYIIDVIMYPRRNIHLLFFSSNEIQISSLKRGVEGKDGERRYADGELASGTRRRGRARSRAARRSPAGHAIIRTYARGIRRAPQPALASGGVDRPPMVLAQPQPCSRYGDRESSCESPAEVITPALRHSHRQFAERSQVGRLTPSVQGSVAAIRRSVAQASCRVPAQPAQQRLQLVRSQASSRAV